MRYFASIFIFFWATASISFACTPPAGSQGMLATYAVPEKRASVKKIFSPSSHLTVNLKRKKRVRGTKPIEPACAAVTENCPILFSELSPVFAEQSVTCLPYFFINKKRGPPARLV